MQKLLIIGASTLQLPAIKLAKQLGYHTIVADYNKYAVGVSFADEYYNVSTIDEEGILELAKQVQPDGIMTLATDMPMRSIARATSALNIPGISYDTAIRSTDKGEMIQVFEKHNVEHPWYYIVNKLNTLSDIKENIQYPCVVKPTDNAGNRGVCFVGNEDELIEAYEYSLKNSRSGDVIIEEYMEGHEVSVEIIVVNSQVHIIAITDKQTLGVPYFVEIGHSQQSQLSPEDIVKIKDLATRAVTAIGIDNSPAHVEIMLTADGPKMVELGARLGGGCITTHLVPLSTGVNMVKAVIDLSLGNTPDIQPKYCKGSALLHITGVEGIITRISGIEDAQKIEGIKEVNILKNIGDETRYFMNGNDRIGYVIAQGANAEDALNRCREALNLIKIETQKSK